MSVRTEASPGPRSPKKIYLISVYSDKDEIRSLGGLFDYDMKQWYFMSLGSQDEALFNRWSQSMTPSNECDKVYLNCPLREKDAAKALGAKWDPSVTKWYITSDFDTTRFARWLPKPRRSSKRSNHNNIAHTYAKRLKYDDSENELNTLEDSDDELNTLEDSDDELNSLDDFIASEDDINVESGAASEESSSGLVSEEDRMTPSRDEIEEEEEQEEEEEEVSRRSRNSEIIQHMHLIFIGVPYYSYYLFVFCIE